MNHRARYVAVVVPLVAAMLVESSASLRVAEASCNAMPDAFMLTGKTPTRSGPGVPVFRYRGAVGRVDRPYYLPPLQGEPAEVLQVDAAEGRLPAGATAQAASELEAYLVFRATGEETKPVLVNVAGAERCQRIATELAAGGAVALSRFRALGCAPATKIEIREADGYRWIAITLPGEESLTALAERAGGPLEGAMTVVVTSPRDPLIEKLATARCADIAERFTGAACIDQLFVALPGVQTLKKAGVDSSVCQFHLPPKNDFKRLCHHSKAAHPKKCAPDQDTVEIYVDDCGNARMQFYWQPLLDPAPGNKHLRRDFAGATTLPRFAGASGPHIRIPGREYLASTDIGGHGFPSKPNFAPSKDPAPGATVRELRLEGDADEKRSVLHLFPRTIATRVCRASSPEEACDGVDKGEDDRSCKDDRGASGGQCDSPQGGNRYFACDSGSYAGEPCTRPRHCWVPKPDGSTDDDTPRCSAKPRCWDPATNTLTATECTQHGDCPGAEECGRPLFDLRPRRNSKDIVEVQRLPAAGEQGVCAGADMTASPSGCTSDADCDATKSEHCVRYRLEAGENTP